MFCTTFSLKGRAQEQYWSFTLKSATFFFLMLFCLMVDVCGFDPSTLGYCHWDTAIRVRWGSTGFGVSPIIYEVNGARLCYRVRKWICRTYTVFLDKGHKVCLDLSSILISGLARYNCIISTICEKYSDWILVSWLKLEFIKRLIGKNVHKSCCIYIQPIMKLQYLKKCCTFEIWPSQICI